MGTIFVKLKPATAICGIYSTMYQHITNAEDQITEDQYNELGTEEQANYKKVEEAGGTEEVDED